MVSGTFKEDSTNILGAPSPNPIPNNSSINYSYIINPVTLMTGTENSITNTVTTQVNNANLNNINKSVDKIYVTCGDKINCNIYIQNSRNGN